ncbi:conserved hypothetical protein [Cupriavidus taiwanensis]|nr:conserved hypothetical protein [Cupriavidus taiwanensis]SOZ77418.1 conserved hypothetical protein [Cupriavidus taiwanensis]SOZ88832.1 conserved hypothetical protein [Cupriavidus taiwanensis]SPD57454.1 conserved protein of unknown function [Cupriavidus taiwanensis]
MTRGETMKAVRAAGRLSAAEGWHQRFATGAIRSLIAFLFTAAAGLAQAAPPHSPGAPESDDWQFAIAPYLWLPNVSGDFRFSGSSSTGGGNLDIGTGPDSYLQNLQFLLMLQAEARKGNWSIFGDAIYLDFSRQDTTLKSVTAGNGTRVVVPRDVATDVGSSMTGGMLQLAAGYTALRAPWGNIEPFGGLRYLNLSASAHWTLSATFTQQGATLAQQGSISQTENLVDAIIGVRGRFNLSSNGRWYVPYYVDVGSGSSSYTLQVSAGAAYAAKWGDIQLTYRYVSYEVSGGELIQRLTFKGPMLGLVFRF